jgi:hypothetical protein
MLRLRQVTASTSDRDSRIGDDNDDREPAFFTRHSSSTSPRTRAPQITIYEEPVAGALHRKKYLFLYDTVPGGTLFETVDALEGTIARNTRTRTRCAARLRLQPGATAGRWLLPVSLPLS